MLQRVNERDFSPECVSFDDWYSGLDNLKYRSDKAMIYGSK